VALGAACGYCKSGFAIVAGTTGFALGHVSHGHPLAVTVGKYFGVAVVALIGCGVEIMAEVADNGATTVLEGQVGWFVVDMAGTTVCFNGEGDLAVMATAAGLAFFHISHSCLAGSLTVVIFFAMAVVASVGLCVKIMAEHSVSSWF